VPPRSPSDSSPAPHRRAEETSPQSRGRWSSWSPVTFRRRCGWIGSHPAYVMLVSAAICWYDFTNSEGGQRSRSPAVLRPAGEVRWTGGVDNSRHSTGNEGRRYRSLGVISLRPASRGSFPLDGGNPPIIVRPIGRIVAAPRTGSASLMDGLTDLRRNI
jgi:hypothetical protein